MAGNDIKHEIWDFVEEVVDLRFVVLLLYSNSVQFIVTVNVYSDKSNCQFSEVPRM